MSSRAGGDAPRPAVPRPAGSPRWRDQGPRKGPRRRGRRLSARSTARHTAGSTTHTETHTKTRTGPCVHGYGYLYVHPLIYNRTHPQPHSHRHTNVHTHRRTHKPANICTQGKGGRVEEGSSPGPLGARRMGVQPGPALNPKPRKVVTTPTPIRISSPVPTTPIPE